MLTNVALRAMTYTVSSGALNSTPTSTARIRMPLLLSTGRAAINRYLLPAGPKTAT